MTAEAILLGASCVLLYFVGMTQLREMRELRRLRALCRRCAEHLADIESDGRVRDSETHLALLDECERAGWTEGGKER